MNKSAIQKYAIWARNELIEQVKQRAYQYGISEKGYGNEHEVVISGRVLTAEEQRQRQAFVVQVQKQGYQQAVEDVAYTWFNRFVALRFMEVNDYLPTHVRVFSDASGGFNPEILKDALHLDLPGLDKAKVSEYLNTNKTEELYRYLLLTQCNALNEALPEMFERLGSYTEMLLPNNILKVDSVLGRLVIDIPEEDFLDAVQIIGWMYQYYNTEPKQAVFDGLKKNIKITKEKIPAATQLFTPDWIVRYMVENSLGRLWLESHPDDKLRAKWKYYLDDAEQTPDVAEKLHVLRSQSPVNLPEDITLIDPCMGSGHILVYAFDVLMQIYENEGYNPREAAKLILEKNLYGLDIDRRAYQLAYFSLMMKARQYNRRLFTEDVQPQVYYPAGWSDGEEYGSLVKVNKLEHMPESSIEQLEILDDYERDLQVWNFKCLLTKMYDVVVTNPPYMGNSSMSINMSEFTKKNFPDSKNDLFAVFIEKCKELLKSSGYQAMITQHAWMFLSSYEKLRSKLIHSDIINMAHLGARAFEEISGEVVQTTAFVLSNRSISGFEATYLRLVDYKSQLAKESAFLSKKDFYTAIKEDFVKIPGFPIAYWVNSRIQNCFSDGIPLRTLGRVTLGMRTGDNNRFLRFWYEVDMLDFFSSASSPESARQSGCKWFPYNKGGEFRKWYGNTEYVVNWADDGFEIKENTRRAYPQLGENLDWKITSEDKYFSPGVTWTRISNVFGARLCESNLIFDTAAPMFFPDNLPNLKYIAGFMCSSVSSMLLSFLNPTLTFQVIDVGNLPVIIDYGKSCEVKIVVESSYSISKSDWDSFETSWNFVRHPLICNEKTVSSAFTKWKCNTTKRFNMLKANEEELNRIFIDIYGLQDELTAEVEDKDVTVRRADLGRDIRSLISYAVGCMFGRYSLDVEGLAYAGGDWDESKYNTFIPDKDNILPICDDEYFDDDIVGRFVEFVHVVYGAETLEENLKFIADALGGKGTPRDVIRNYFLNSFFADHCKIYQKRPIYWLFDSGKKNGFKALIYLHRYSSDLLAKLRTDYVHEQQERYRTQLSHIDSALNSATGSERARLLKQQDKLSDQLKEITAFEEKIHHLADQNIEIDLDDGVKVNYAKFPDVLAKI